MILINVVIGFYQDLQAQRTIASLNSLNSPTARVIRGGTSSTIDATSIVPGDILELKTGDVVPADARILDCVNLEADEAALTGESVPSRKDPEITFGGGNDSDDSSDDVGPGDRLNVVFSSTTITKGRGRAVVFATGMFTEIGAIAAVLRDNGGDRRRVKRDENGHASAETYLLFGLGKIWDVVGEFLGVTVGTPLQRKLSKLFLTIFGLAIICAIIVMGTNKFAARNDVIIYAITTAIGTLPITLVLVLTITMAAGTKVMVERHVLVRNMRSLEALGGVTSKKFHDPSTGIILTSCRHLFRQDRYLDPRQDGYQDGLAPWSWHLHDQCNQRAIQPRSRRRRVYPNPAERHARRNNYLQGFRS